MTLYGTPEQCKKFPGFYKEFLKQEVPERKNKNLKNKIVSISYLTDFCEKSKINISEGISDYQKEKT